MVAVAYSVKFASKELVTSRLRRRGACSVDYFVFVFIEVLQVPNLAKFTIS